MMTTTTRLTRHCCTALLILGLGTPLLADAESLRFSGNFPNDHSSSKAMEVFKEELASRTNGNLTAQLFPNMQLGGASENVDQVSSGSIAGTWIGPAYLSRIVPELEVLSLPFAFDSREDAFRVIDGEVGKMLDEKLAEKNWFFVVSCGFGLIEQAPHRAANQVDHGDEVGFVPVTPCA
ncbi:TRAP transporter substrate-binding protein DctP [Halomonas piscis]|uniref:TRAP transporter substrate-binding protein DctP n=1 Tax=Halomonas piscis TaxID=3031727 RepID=A0ABY9YY14_9GAMM|nr:TRAP transporter substrate-binding protein DctP [Halomonas piscis]WNK19770.1 TRAP transporter substrate-binding protein DctP [Halomonas piscis]